MLLWNKRYQEVDLVVSSVTTKVKGVAKTRLPEVGDVVWDVADYSGSSQVSAASPGPAQRHRTSLKPPLLPSRTRTPSSW